MAKYNYTKHEKWKTTFVLESSVGATTYNYTVYTNYTLSSTGNVTFIGQKELRNTYIGETVYVPKTNTSFSYFVVKGTYDPSISNYIQHSYGRVEISTGAGRVINEFVADEGLYPTNGLHTDGFWYVRGGLANVTPTIILTTVDGRTFYENETFLISGTAQDTDVGNIVSVKYQINNEPIRAIETKISAGTNIPFNKTLTLKNSRLLDGNTLVTEVLGDGSQHILKVWAEDDQGGKSQEQIRSFYVVANRAPVINVDNIANQSGAVNTDTITISGRASDPDGNTLTAKYRVNTGPLNDLPLVNGEWTLTFPIKQLIDGDNSVIIEATDSYNFKSSKTARLKKEFKANALEQSVQRYKIEPPKGSAKGVLLWVQREETQTVSAEISMVDSGSAESYVPMTLTVTAPIGLDNLEDEFIYEADAPRTNIHLKLNITGSGAVTLISGVLS